MMSNAENIFVPFVDKTPVVQLPTQSTDYTISAATIPSSLFPNNANPIQALYRAVPRKGHGRPRPSIQPVLNTIPWYTDTFEIPTTIQSNMADIVNDIPA